jgi:hypothetical protein
MQLTKLLVLLGAVSTTLAAPATKRQSSSPALPSSSLPAPNTLSPPVTLKQIALGLGHQNYTCDGSGTATAVGATAALFDAKPIISRFPFLGTYLPTTILTFSGLSRDTIPAGQYSAAKDNADYRLGLPQLDVNPVGYHYFNTDKLPTFTLPAFNAGLVARKLANVAAPANAMMGSDGQGCVDWLLLGDSGQNKSYGGLTNVYRVNTAGGSGAGVCAGIAAGSVVRVPYATEYWFYGP